ncbi:hypothetical protein ANN_17373 [Periplaneta americana]|uniref:Uncharacterized protein n=1 Tax=Periplaneta americana TaxID=6978 RepID=A0ABQ8STQ1_PERAM|nr:hypothetical protein ANN_17373 [Periplaneta americana]
MTVKAFCKALVSLNRRMRRARCETAAANHVRNDAASKKKLTSVHVSKQFTFLPLPALPYVSIQIHLLKTCSSRVAQIRLRDSVRDDAARPLCEPPQIAQLAAIENAHYLSCSPDMCEASLAPRTSHASVQKNQGLSKRSFRTVWGKTIFVVRSVKTESDYYIVSSSTLLDTVFADKLLRNNAYVSLIYLKYSIITEELVDFRKHDKCEVCPNAVKIGDFMFESLNLIEFRVEHSTATLEDLRASPADVRGILKIDKPPSAYAVKTDMISWLRKKEVNCDEMVVIVIILVILMTVMAVVVVRTVTPHLNVTLTWDLLNSFRYELFSAFTSERLQNTDGRSVYGYRTKQIRSVMSTTAQACLTARMRCSEHGQVGSSVCQLIYPKVRIFAAQIISIPIWQYIRIWLFNDAVSTTSLFSVDEIGDSEMVFGEVKPRIRHRLSGVHLTVRKNFGKNPTSDDNFIGDGGNILSVIMVILSVVMVILSVAIVIFVDGYGNFVYGDDNFAYCDGNFVDYDDTVIKFRATLDDAYSARCTLLRSLSVEYRNRAVALSGDREATQMTKLVSPERCAEHHGFGPRGRRIV